MDFRLLATGLGKSSKSSLGKPRQVWASGWQPEILDFRPVAAGLGKSRLGKSKQVGGNQKSWI